MPVLPLISQKFAGVQDLVCRQGSDGGPAPREDTKLLLGGQSPVSGLNEPFDHFLIIASCDSVSLLYAVLCGLFASILLFFSRDVESSCSFTAHVQSQLIKQGIIAHEIFSQSPRSQIAGVTALILTTPRNQGKSDLFTPPFTPVTKRTL